ncbi:uncharacterized protein [Aegilops tauschii subsp. strangulata]|uniref:uncharacterized protein n=1 Tax=Aegilops tauschii subsp. strangulata TaxID=200361 RepID=UPI003CC8C3C8
MTAAFAKLDSKLDQLSGRIDDAKLATSVDLDELRGKIGTERGAASFPPTPPSPRTMAVPTRTRPPSSGSSGSDGCRSEAEQRNSGPKYVPPPVRGMTTDPSHSRQIIGIGEGFRPYQSDGKSFGPRIELPRFDGSNPKLWQSQCEDYFRFWNTPSNQWIPFASALFDGTAVRWLESVQRRAPNVSWTEFCELLQSRFGRNKHQNILWQLFHVRQTSTVEEYVERLSELYDQLTAYETDPNPVHYVTRFMEGLTPSVRLIVGMQQPADLDSAYALALLSEELSESSVGSVSSKRSTPSSSRTSVSKPVEDKRSTDTQRSTATEDHWSALRAYRKSKRLCFICGERWAQDHRCKQEEQLHVVQEMLDYVQSMPSEQSDSEDSVSTEANAISISAATMGDVTAPATTTMKLKIQLQGRSLVFLVDSGSTHTFLDTATTITIKGITEMPVTMVKVANGRVVPCNKQLLKGLWSFAGHEFTSTFKVFPLGSYDGILGLDWLAAHSPMQVDWAAHWQSFHLEDKMITLLGQDAAPQMFAMVELSALLATKNPSLTDVPPEVQEILQRFAPVFEAPTGLPPRRKYDHTIPLVPRAQPVYNRPYIIAPALKDEMEKQVKDMLASGIIRPNNSAFSSPMIMVQKKDKTSRPVFDYRKLNAITVKSKYPIPIIDELLNKLAGAKWFSKLVLGLATTRSDWHLERNTRLLFKHTLVILSFWYFHLVLLDDLTLPILE